MQLKFLGKENGIKIYHSMKMKKILKILGITILTIIILVGAGFFWYVSDYEKATQPVMAAMEESDKATVRDLEDYIVYKPKDEVNKGIIFYPGGKVEPKVYSRVFIELADRGIQTVVVKMPFNLAMFNIDGAEEALETYTDVETWYLGGHSLGGVFATEYLKDHSEQFSGMIYMASYPDADVSNLDIDVLSLNGTLDTVINREGYESGKDKLPADTVYYDIVGGNHTQFGDYNLQDGDTEATISAEEQHEIIVEQILSFME